MNTLVKNILAVIFGIVAGGIVNMGLIMIGSSIVAPPPGADLTTVDGLNAAMPLLGPQHFLVPFLAHALGTLVSALVASLIAASHRMYISMAFGVIGLAGGIAAAAMIPAPLWFKALDLIAAYIPMAFIGWKLSGRN